MPTETSLKAEEALIHVLWINAGLSCDGDSVALTAATQPSVEEIALGALPGLPRIAMHWPLIDFECGPQEGADDFLEWFRKADRGELEPFVLVVEGSIPNEKLHAPGGDWCGFGLAREVRVFGRLFLGFGDLLDRGVRLDFGVVRLASFEPGGGEIELDLGRAAVEAAREALEEFL